MFLLNGNRLPEGTSFYDANGVQYGSGWLNQATEAQKLAIGITWVADPAPIDNRFYWDTDLPKALEDVTETVDGKEYITKGLKSNFKAQVKDTANKLLANTDWYVIRKAERGISVPTTIADQRSVILYEASRLETAIDGVNTVEELITILNNQTWSSNG